MDGAKAVTDRIKREQDEQQQADEAANQNLKLQAGIRPFWSDLQAALRRELDDFNGGTNPPAGRLQGISLDDDHFSVDRDGLRTLEIVLREREQILESEYLSDRPQTARASFEYDSIQIVTLDGYTADEVAGRLLAPLFHSFQPSK